MKASKKSEPLSAQSQAFKEAARELGCDDSEERFVETVRRLAKAGPQHRPTKAKPARTK